MQQTISQLPVPPEPQRLATVLERLPRHPPGHSSGPDIDRSNELLLAEDVPKSTKIDHLLSWIARNQPCMFGRLAARGGRGLAVDVCWLDDRDVERGDELLRDEVQRTRRAWKERAERGESHGLLVMFNCRALAEAAPSHELLAISRQIADLYFVEHAPVESDIIYTEAVPLRDASGQMLLFKAGANLFYTGAHRTRNHDRRLPGGLMISVNSIGHYANSLVLKGIVESLDQAVAFVRDLAWRSIGNGGIGAEEVSSTSWHNRDPTRSPQECPIKNRPAYIPARFSPHFYSALYHTDILVPISVTVDGTEIGDEPAESETWSHLKIGYIDTRPQGPYDEEYGMFHGHPIPDEARYHNPWPPLRATNDPRLFYGNQRYLAAGKDRLASEEV